MHSPAQVDKPGRWLSREKFVAIQFLLGRENGALFACVPGQIALTASVQIQRADPTVAAQLPSARPLFHDCLHDRVLKLRPHLANGGLDHHHGHQILLRVHPEVSAIGAAPAEATV